MQPPSDRPRPSPAALAGRTVVFAVLVLGAWLAVLRVAAAVPWGRYTLLELVTRVYERPGTQFSSLARFREAARRGPVDVVFMGSSHAYRSFDPRIFEAEGLTSMNLGSTAQSPLDTRYVAEAYLPKLRPRLCVVEVYYATLMSDGTESARDLLVNTPASWPMTKMALRTWDLGVVGFATAKGLGFAGDESKAEQVSLAPERYVEGGYVEATGHRPWLLPGPPVASEVRSDQIDHLVALTTYARSLGATVVWVTHPLPKDHRERLPDARAIHEMVLAGAREAGVPYWDFDESLELDPLADYLDFHHLNASGVKKFDEAFLARARQAGVLPEPSR